MTAIGGAVMMTVPEADCPLALARIVTGFDAGTAMGAVNVATDGFELDEIIVPSVESPPTTPLTSQTTAVAGGTHKEALNTCVAPVWTLAVGGESEPDDAHVIVTLAVADFDGSAMLVAVTLTVGGDEGTGGAI